MDPISILKEVDQIGKGPKVGPALKSLQNETPVMA
jgi:hypothetical protein